MYLIPSLPRPPKIQNYFEVFKKCCLVLFSYVYLSFFTTHYDEILLPLWLRISVLEVILSAFFIDAYMILHNCILRHNIYL